MPNREKKRMREREGERDEKRRIRRIDVIYILKEREEERKRGRNDVISDRYL
jgi:hypothetical protein